MKLGMSSEAMTWAVFVSVTVRGFIALALEAPTGLQNGAWISPLIGVVPVLLWLLWLENVAGEDSSHHYLAAKVLSPVLLVVTLLDGGAILSTLVRSAAYLALDRRQSILQAIPLCLAVFWCTARNGDSVGYAAKLGTRLFPLLLLPVLLLQARYFRPGWLRPLLGNGVGGIVEGGVRMAGKAIPAASVLLLREKDTKRAPGTMFHIAFGSTAVLCGLLLAFQMMMPTQQTPMDWMGRLDALLTNGRGPLYLQLPMIAMWYFGLLHLISVECFASAALLQRLTRLRSGLACCGICVCAIAAIWLTGLHEAAQSAPVQQLQFAAIGMLAALLILAIAIGGDKKCGSSN